MTNVGTDELLRRVEILRRGRERKEPSEAEIAALKFVEKPTYRAATNVLVEINREPGVRSYRPAVLRARIKAMEMRSGNAALNLKDAAIKTREQNRAIGRALPRRAVGSTLLLKGLEADVAVILDASELDKRNLYVAMTRGSKELVICSSAPVLTPR